MRIREIVLEDISRRGFLRGAGAAAALGGLGLSSNAKAQSDMNIYLARKLGIIAPFTQTGNMYIKNGPHMFQEILSAFNPVMRKNPEYKEAYDKAYDNMMSTINAYRKRHDYEEQLLNFYNVVVKDWPEHAKYIREKSDWYRNATPEQPTKQAQQSKPEPQVQQQVQRPEPKAEKPTIQQVDNHRLADGEIYTGELVNGLPNGRGRVTNTSGVVIFNHNWVDGRPDGQGWVKFQNGITINGQMRKDLSFYNATMKFTDGAEITGSRWKIIPGFNWTYAAVEDTAIVRLPDGKMVKVRFNMGSKQYDPVQ